MLPNCTPIKANNVGSELDKLTAARGDPGQVACFREGENPALLQSGMINNMPTCESDFGTMGFSECADLAIGEDNLDHTCPQIDTAAAG